MRLSAPLGLLALACSIEDVELVGRKCPCPSDLSCVNDVCVRASAAGAGGAGGGGAGAASGGAAGGGLAGGGLAGGGVAGGAGSGGVPCAAAITVDDFRVDWETPNTVRWRWDPHGAPELFSAYELVTAENQADLGSGTGSATIWTVSANPELGEFIVPDSGSLSDVIDRTITDGHTPKTTYYAKLSAIDKSGCRFESAQIQAVTTDPPQFEIEIFSDAAVPQTVPSSYSLSTSGALSGSACLAYVQPACTPPYCYENLKAQGMQLASGGKLNENQFVTKAFLELSVAIEEPVHSYWSQIWLMLSGNQDIWKLEPIVARADGQYRTYQIPLRALDQSGTLLSFAKFDSSGIAGFNFGGSFVGGKRVRVDEASIKW
jgi:hypothetical protein